MMERDEAEELLDRMHRKSRKVVIIVEDHCVVCGAVIPEGGMVCKECWEKWMGNSKDPKKEKIQNESKLESPVQK